MPSKDSLPGLVVEKNYCVTKIWTSFNQKAHVLAFHNSKTDVLNAQNSNVPSKGCPQEETVLSNGFLPITTTLQRDGTLPVNSIEYEFWKFERQTNLP